MSLFISSVFTYDEDAGNYIQAVETADAQALEPATRKAINDFVIGCKADGIWSAIKASCILAGARTRLGALTPLVGTAPTSFGFVDGDYNRKTGLVGDGTSKYLNSNRNNNADPQNNHHMAIYGQRLTSSSQSPIGGRNGSPGVDIGGKFILFNTSASIAFVSNPDSDTRQTGTNVSVNATSFFGLSRSLSANYTSRSAATSTSHTQASASPVDRPLPIFALNNATSNGLMTPVQYSASRLAFYSIGESLDLARLDSRVTDLINAFAVTIP